MSTPPSAPPRPRAPAGSPWRTRRGPPAPPPTGRPEGAGDNSQGQRPWGPDQREPLDPPRPHRHRRRGRGANPRGGSAHEPPGALPLAIVTGPFRAKRSPTASLVLSLAIS